MPNFKRVVVTGAPGTGKSTVLNLLTAKGFPVLPEMARELIAEQQAIENSTMVPWLDHPSFGLELFKRQVQQYQDAQEGVNFYDRGILDNLAYLRRDECPNESLEQQAKDYPYHPDIFLMPPWEEIYSNDSVRWEDLDLMRSIDKALRSMYSRFGYQVIEVPKVGPEERMHFILEHLQIDG